MAPDASGQADALWKQVGAVSDKVDRGIEALRQQMHDMSNTMQRGIGQSESDKTSGRRETDEIKASVASIHTKLDAMRDEFDAKYVSKNDMKPIYWGGKQVWVLVMALIMAAGSILWAMIVKKGMS